MPVCLILAAWILVSPGEPNHAADERYRLDVRPRVCVTLERDSACSMQLLVNWTGPVADNVCLKLEDADQVLQCWQQQRSGEFTLALQRTDTAVLQLLAEANDTVLQQAEVTVVSRDLRDSRRRRRHVWSIL